MEQSPSSNTKRRLPRRAMVVLAALGMSGLLLQPEASQHRDSSAAAAYVEDYASKVDQQLDRIIPTSLDMLERAETHNDRYGVREPLLAQNAAPNVFFNDTLLEDSAARTIAF